MNLTFALALLAAQVALADEPPASIQIGKGVTVGVSTNPVKGPLDNKVNLRLPNGSLQDFFEELSRQTKLEFIIVQGLEQCRVGAYLRDLSAREALGLTIRAGGISYQQLGRSNRYTITRGLRGSPNCPPNRRPIGIGSCVGGGAPISLECTDGNLSEWARLVYEQSDASIVVWNEAVEFPVSMKLKQASLKKAIKNIRKHRSLSIQQNGKTNQFLFSRERPEDGLDQSSVQVSSRIVTITPRGTQFGYPDDYRNQKRKEAPANPVFKSEMPN